ncbi:helix-turn-helix domain-containing protein [Endozoicomonas sp. OPT23]|uniref:helix-turn-helix domain-containing protein n=1 Tax=Endozoicomonas sp. OPT23 TaxID=2072845 RepID=UPI001891CDDC|nr:helix-turn-helix domain-containing protein [Endozoicomonas sp. OPT23]
MLNLKGVKNAEGKKTTLTQKYSREALLKLKGGQAFSVWFVMADDFLFMSMHDGKTVLKHYQPTAGTLAEKTGLGVQAVRRAIKALKEAGLITTVSSKKGFADYLYVETGNDLRKFFPSLATSESVAEQVPEQEASGCTSLTLNTAPTASPTYHPSGLDPDAEF